MIHDRPCGACRALVGPAGCKHWRRDDAPVPPEVIARRTAGASARRKARADAREAVEKFQAVMGVGR